MAKLTEAQRDMMQHALGYGHPEHKPGWRNHYATEPGCTGWEDWQDLIARGLAVDRGQYPDGGLHCLSVTEAGRAALSDSEGSEHD